MGIKAYSVFNEPMEADLDVKKILADVIKVSLYEVTVMASHELFVRRTYIGLDAARNRMGNYYLAPVKNDNYINGEISDVLRKSAVIEIVDEEEGPNLLRVKAVTPLFLGEKFQCWNCEVERMEAPDEQEFRRITNGRFGG